MGIADAPYELKLELCHNIVEFIIDIQIWMHDPALAGRVMAAAAGRDAGFPGILTQAYSQLLADFSQTTGAPLSLYAAQAWIQGYEAQFQQREVLYASLYASATDLAGAITNLSAYLSVLANTLYGLETNPAGVAQILWLAFDQLPNAISELDGTAKFVRAELAKHQVFFGPRGYMDSKARTTKGSQSSR
jgi:hypothetical protein